MKGDPLGFFSEKSHNAEKNLEGGPFSLSRYGMLRGKRGKTFLVSSLGQMIQFIQFGTIKFCSTVGQFVWIEKKEKKSHYNSRVSLHEAPNKNHVSVFTSVSRLPADILPSQVELAQRHMGSYYINCWLPALLLQ